MLHNYADMSSAQFKLTQIPNGCNCAGKPVRYTGVFLLPKDSIAASQQFEKNFFEN